MAKRPTDLDVPPPKMPKLNITAARRMTRERNMPFPSKQFFLMRKIAVFVGREGVRLVKEMQSITLNFAEWKTLAERMDQPNFDIHLSHTPMAGATRNDDGLTLWKRGALRFDLSPDEYNALNLRRKSINNHIDLVNSSTDYFTKMMEIIANSLIAGAQQLDVRPQYSWIEDQDAFDTVYKNILSLGLVNTVLRTFNSESDGNCRLNVFALLMYCLMQTSDIREKMQQQIE